MQVVWDQEEVSSQLQTALGISLGACTDLLRHARQAGVVPQGSRNWQSHWQDLQQSLQAMPRPLVRPRSIMNRIQAKRVQHMRKLS